MTKSMCRLGRVEDRAVDALNVVRALVDMVGVTKDGDLYNGFTGEAITCNGKCNSDETFLAVLWYMTQYELSAREIIDDIAHHYYEV